MQSVVRAKGCCRPAHGTNTFFLAGSPTVIRTVVAVNFVAFTAQYQFALDMSQNVVMTIEPPLWGAANTKVVATAEATEASANTCAVFFKYLMKNIKQSSLKGETACIFASDEFC